MIRLLLVENRFGSPLRLLSQEFFIFAFETFLVVARLRKEIARTPGTEKNILLDVGKNSCYQRHSSALSVAFYLELCSRVISFACGMEETGHQAFC
jgi:hypothetical protein